MADRQPLGNAEKTRRNLTVANVVLSVASAYTTYEGQSSSGHSLVDSIIGAVAAFTFIFMMYHIFIRYIYQATPTVKVLLSIVMVASLPVFYGISTQFTILQFGGLDAVRKHRSDLLNRAEQQGYTLSSQSERQANMVPELTSIADGFDAYADREAKGAFSGLKGEGEVVATLRNTSQVVRGLAKDATANLERRRALSDTLHREIDRARRLSVSDTIGAREINLRFAGEVAKINEISVRLGQISDKQFVNSVTGNLRELSLVSKQDARAEQKDALQRLQSIVGGAQKVLSDMTKSPVDTNATGDPVNADVQIQTFEVISPAMAIWRYKGEVWPAIALGLALDYGLLVLILLFTSGQWGEDRRAQEERERRMHGPAGRDSFVRQGA